MTQPLILPDLVIAGAPKCGTSSLFEWLRLHPGLNGSTCKETHFLSDKPDPNAVSFKRDGLAAYEAYFQPGQADSLLMEATPEYLYQETPLDVLAEQATSTRVIVVLRQPARRVWSAFSYARHNLGAIPADQHFADYLKSSFGQGVVAQSHYARYLKSWEEQLGDRLKVLLFEQLVADPHAGLTELSEWLGIDAEFWDTVELNARNTTLQLRSRGLHELGVHVARFLPAGWVNRLMPVYQRWNATSAPAMTQEDRRELVLLDEVFAADKAYIESSLGLDLSLWSTVSDEMNENNHGPKVKTS